MKSLDILLADDDSDDCHFFKEAVKDLESKVNLVIVNDGEQLMKLLMKKSSELPDVLFLDLNMPRKNGFECLSEIKSNKNLNSLKIIIFSTSYEQEMVNLLFENGALFFIRKPSDFLHYKKIIQQTITLITNGMTMTPNRENFVINTRNL